MFELRRPAWEAMVSGNRMESSKAFDDRRGCQMFDYRIFDFQMFDFFPVGFFAGGKWHVLLLALIGQSFDARLACDRQETRQQIRVGEIRR